MHYNLVIWDYNGTIIDDVQTGIDSVNVLLRKRSLKTVDSLEYYQSKFGFPIIDYYARLGFDFSKEPYEIIAHEWVKEYVSREKDIPLVKHVVETLQGVKERHVPQIILSSCEKKMLTRQLEFYGLLPYFDEILGLDNVYAGGKIGMAKEWIKGKNYKAIMIGDTTHDYQTAKAIGADCVLYYGGNESVESLAQNGVPVLKDVYQLLAYLSNFR